MIRVRIYSNVTELDYDVEINARVAWQLLNILNTPNFPTITDFENKYVFRDIDQKIDCSGREIK